MCIRFKENCFFFKKLLLVKNFCKVKYDDAFMKTVKKCI